MRDLTIIETRDAIKRLTAEVGSQCSLSVNICTSAHQKALLVAYFSPAGSGSAKPFFALYGDTFREVLAACEAEWVEYADLHGANIIREMALAIIAITADQGECSDAALRAKFDAADIKRHGDQACAQATEMASNGPFSIVSLSGANDVGQAA